MNIYFIPKFELTFIKMDIQKFITTREDAAAEAMAGKFFNLFQIFSQRLIFFVTKFAETVFVFRKKINNFQKKN